jgi:putative transposase
VLQTTNTNASPIERFRKPSIGSLSTFIRTFKAAVTRRAGREINSGNVWQRNFYKHIIRGDSDFQRIAAYILDNPVNWDQDEENLFPEFP